MDLPNFHPGDTQAVPSFNTTEDSVAKNLRRLSKLILVLTLGLLPVLFWPSPYVAFSSGKLMILLAGIFLSVLVFGLYVLRSGALTFRLPWPIIGIWSVAIVSTIAAFSAGDIVDSLWGNTIEAHTVAFIWCLAIVMSVTGILAESMRSFVRLYAILITTALLLSLWHFVRLMFGAEALSLGFFTSDTATTLGGWNSLAIFYGLILLLSVLSLLQLSLSRVASIIVNIVALAALVMLAIINFITVWYLVAVVSGLLLLYALVTNLWSAKQRPTINWSTFGLSGVILAVSLVFIFSGSFLGGKISETTGISYLEVRPSFDATVDMARAVYSDSALLGAGPNRFADVWRLHKDSSINQTIFWNAEFTSGHSYLSTSVIESGLLGLAAWVFFLGTFILYGWRFIFQAQAAKDFWYFIGLSSLVSSVYLWIIAALYVPSSTILVLTALTSGVFLVAYAKLLPGKNWTISVERNRVFGFILVALVILVVAGGSLGLYTIGKQNYSIYTFNRAQNKSESVTELETGIAAAFNTFRNDALARELAFYQLAQMREYLSLSEATAEQQQQFRNLVEQGINAASMAINLDPTDPRNHQVLGNIYAVLAVVGVEGAEDRALEAFAKSEEFDPKNPTPSFLEADLYASIGNLEAARAAAEEAVRIRPTYTEAIFFLAQLDLNAGDVEEAIRKVVAVVQLEPQNPARLYQLGLLLSGVDRLEEAILAFEQAVALDPQYANARYFLALGYAELGRTEEATEQLIIVRDLNESNTLVNELIERLRNGESLSDTGDATVAEREVSDGSVTAEDLEDTELVTSPNPVGE